MDDPEAFEALLALLDELDEASLTTPVLVEGRRDAEALRRLGVRGEVRLVHRGVPLLRVCEAIAQRARHAIVLTDWDPKGDQLFASLRDVLQSCGVRPDATFREGIRRHVRAPLQGVEDLADHVARGLARHHGRDLDERRGA